MRSFSYTGGTQSFQVQHAGTYRIVAFGAAGGATASGGNGGAGAEVLGEFDLAAGTVLKLIVGGRGGYAAAGQDSGAGGGGGTFVIETFNGAAATDVLLLVSGGGGGSGTRPGGYYGGGFAYATNSGRGAPGGAAGTGGGGGGGGFHGGGGGAGGQAGQAGSGFHAGQSYAGGAGTQGGAGGYGGGGGGGFHGGGGGGGGYGGGAGGSGAGYGGYGGGSLDVGQNALLSPNVNGGNGSVVVTPLCFLRGTRILTPTGEVRVEELQVGDSVVTRFGGIQPVRWVGRHSHPAGDPALTPVCIHAGALGERLPARDLYVSPGHSVLVDGTLLIARLLVNGVTVTQDWCPQRIDYVHIELAAHDCVIAEGAWAETYADAQVSRAAFDNAAEYEALYPEAGPAPDEFTLCAPRPERGAKLEAALRPILARAEAVAVRERCHRLRS